MQMLEKLVQLLFRKLELGKKLSAGHSSAKKHLEQLHPGQNREALLEEYFCKKITRSLVICLVGVVLGIAVFISTALKDTLKEGYLPRGDYGEEAEEWKLTASISGDGGMMRATAEESQFFVEVSARELTEEECKEVLAEFLDRLPELILQESNGVKAEKNSSLDRSMEGQQRSVMDREIEEQQTSALQRVTEDLNLTEQYESYPFVVEWKSDRPEVLTSTGTIFSVEKAESVTLHARITYGNRSWDETLDVVVIPKVLSAEEQFAQEMEALLAESEQSGREEEWWYLPESFQGQAITWQSERDNTPLVMILGAFGVALLVFVMADKDLYDELLEKRKAHKARYPDLVAKLTLYLGAGLTVRAAFQRLAGEYEAEIGYVCRQLQAGVSETAAYEQLGKRTGVQEYIRLSTLLTQNLKKGNGDLLKRLREEINRAENEKLQTCKKLAEEASTKLLVPMVLFLVVVMVMVMLPAFLSVEM